MDMKSLFVLIPLVVLVIGFIYMNFILTKKIENEKNQKEENKR